MQRRAHHDRVSRGELMNDQSPHQPTELITVPLNEEEVAAVDGWRHANRINSRSAAIRQLIRLGLLSEVGRIYQSVTDPDHRK